MTTESMLTAAAQVTADNWPGYIACCVLVGAIVWAVVDLLS